MKKKFLILVLAMSLVLSMATGCGKKGDVTEPTAEPTAVTEEVATDAPTTEPEETQAPSEEATKEPTKEPTKAPTQAPTQEPTKEPTKAPTPVPAPSFTASEVAEKVIANIGENNLVLMESELYNDIFGINPADYDSVAVFASMMNIKSNEVIVIKAKDAAGVAKAQSALQARYTAIDETWKRYLPDQYELVKQGKIVTNGNYVALIIGQDSASAVKAFNSIA